MVKKYHVTLSADEQQILLSLVHHGTAKARTLTRARILLLVAEGLTDAAIAAVLQTNHSTVERTRQKYQAGGLDVALTERPRPGREPKLDGRQEAFLIALACSAPPEGRTCWTMQLLADQMVTLQQVDAISDETIRLRLKKIRSSPGSAKNGVSRR